MKFPIISVVLVTLAFIIFGGVTVRPALTQTGGMISIGDFRDSCLDKGGKFITFSGGACRDFPQFQDIDANTLQYWHQTADFEWNKSCTAAFNIPSGYYYLYQDEGKTYEGGVGPMTIEEVCWLRISTDSIQPPNN